MNNKRLLVLSFFFMISAQAMHRVDMKKTYARDSQRRVCKTDHVTAPEFCSFSFRRKCVDLPKIGGLGALLLISMMASGMLVDQVQGFNGDFQHSRLCKNCPDSFDTPIKHYPPESDIYSERDCTNLTFRSSRSGKKDWCWCCSQRDYSKRAVIACMMGGNCAYLDRLNDEKDRFLKEKQREFERP